MSVEPKKIAIIGGETHIGEITKLDSSLLEIVGASVREDQKEWARDTLRTENLFPDAETLLEKVQPDIVAVSNENHLKAKTIHLALDRGCAVIVDKPLAIQKSEVEAIRDRVKNQGARLLMLLTLRGHAQYRKVKELVSGGAIGEPVQCQAKMSVELKPDKRPPWFLDQRYSGGPILDLAIHSIDAIEWVTGLTLKSVSAFQSHQTHPEMEQLVDSGACFFEMKNGGTAFIQHNRLLPPGCGNDYRLDIVGTEGQIEFRLNKYLKVQKEGNTIEEFPLDSLGENLSVVEDWLLSLSDPDREVLVSDSISIRANWLSCLAQEAADSGKTLSL